MKKPAGLSSQSLLLVIVALWVVVTLALAGWWWLHGLQQISILTHLEPGQENRFTSQHRMMLWEGFTFMSLLLTGGAGLFFLLLRESRRNEQMKLFFATFTHELKTPLASLRLQAEALQEDLPSANPLVDRLLHDASRLELQLDNALFLATVRNSDQIHLEPVSLTILADRLRSAFPDFKIEIRGDASILADQRAIESVFKNLIQNARIHGNATALTIDIASDKNSSDVKIVLRDNGQGFKGSSAALGKLFYRHTSQSGSGIGLHLTQLLLERMRGGLRVLPSEVGFALELSLRRALS